MSKNLQRLPKQIYKLGQSIMKYDTPQHIMDKLNKIYDNKKKNKLKSAGSFLAGKIKNEYILYNDQPDCPPATVLSPTPMVKMLGLSTRVIFLSGN